MRLNRMDRKRKTKRENIFHIILFFIILPVLALGIGYIVANYIIIPIYFP